MVAAVNKYEVIEKVRQVVIRERRWNIEAISEQDAIREVKQGTASRGYRGQRDTVVSSDPEDWSVNDQLTEYRPAEAVPVDDGIADIGGGD